MEQERDKDTNEEPSSLTPVPDQSLESSSEETILGGETIQTEGGAIIAGSVTNTGGMNIFGGQFHGFSIPSLPSRTITAQPAQIQATTPTVQIEQEKLAPQTILTRRSSPLSIGWCTEGCLALDSLGGALHIVGMDGHVQKEIPVKGSPNYIAVYNEKELAALCYKDLYVVNMITDEIQSVEVDSRVSSYTVAWSEQGDYIAVGATNVLQVFTHNLVLVYEYQLGKNHLSARALAWGGNGATLYVGISNGEFWRLTEPFDSPTVLFKGTSFLIGMRSSKVDERLACLWRDGTLEIRREAEVLASMVVHSSDTWCAYGPKLAWCLSQNILACTTGMYNELILWQLDKGLALSCHMERQVLALDTSPSGEFLAVALDANCDQDAVVQIVPLANVAIASTEATLANKQGIVPHLLTADWNDLIKLIEDQHNGVEPAYALKLNIPKAEKYFVGYEHTLQKEGIEADNSRDLQLARKRTNEILDNLLWAAAGMRKANYTEHDIRRACDGILSFSVNHILGQLGIPGFPAIGSLEEFVAFTLGNTLDDLISIGFDASDGRNVVAEIPLDFLINARNFVQIVEELGSTFGAKSKREKINIACQLVCDFDAAFSLREQRDLWVLYVLPLSVTIKTREDVIIHPSKVKRFGLA